MPYYKAKMCYFVEMFAIKFNRKISLKLFILKRKFNQFRTFFIYLVFTSCILSLHSQHDNLNNHLHRWGGEESPEVCPHQYCCFTAHLFPGILCCVCVPHADDALLHAQWEEPPAHSIWLCRLESSQICCGCGIPLRIVHKVWNSVAIFEFGLN